MTVQKYPRSPKVLLGGMAHLALRHVGSIQDYNYITTGFDKYLIDFLQINPTEYEQRVLEGRTDEELLTPLKVSYEEAKTQAQLYMKIVGELPGMRKETVDLVQQVVTTGRRAYVW